MDKCKICDEYEINDLRGFAAHLFQCHKFRMKDYYDKFIKTKNDGICLTCGSLTNFKGYRYGYYDYCSRKCQCRSKECLLKNRITCNKRYGVDNPSQSIIVKHKKIKTSIKNWGVECPLQSKIIQNKSKKTSLENYGTSSPNQSEEVKLKQKLSCVKKYGGVGFGSDIIRLKIEKSCLKKYGVDNYSKTDKCKDIARKNFARFNIFGFPGKGLNEDIIIEQLQFIVQNNILRNQIIGGFYPDGLVEHLDLIIEIDESYHRKPWAILHDKKKNEIYNDLGYIVFRIKESEWLSDSEPIIQKFKEVINNERI